MTIGSGPPSVTISAASFSSSSARRATTMARTPSRANNVVVTRPIPALAPEIKAVLPASCRSILRPFGISRQFV